MKSIEARQGKEDWRARIYLPNIFRVRTYTQGLKIPYRTTFESILIHRSAALRTSGGLNSRQ
jgi:hypothetical protein